MGYMPFRPSAPLIQLCGVLALVLSFMPQAPAQTATTGALTGVILDPSAAVLPGLLVDLYSNAGEKKSVTTDGSGRFNFLLLPPGRYDLLVTKTGFDPIHLSGL